MSWTLRIVAAGFGIALGAVAFSSPAHADSVLGGLGDVVSGATGTTQQVARQLAAPARQVAKPVRQVVKPVRQVAKPVRQAVKPVRQVAKPVRQAAEPVRQVPRTVRQVVKPVRHVVEPVRSVAKPIRQAAKPVRKPASAARPNPTRTVTAVVARTADVVQRADRRLVTPLTDRADTSLPAPVTGVVDAVHRGTVGLVDRTLRETVPTVLDTTEELGEVLVPVVDEVLTPLPVPRPTAPVVPAAPLAPGTSTPAAASTPTIRTTATPTSSAIERRVVAGTEARATPAAALPHALLAPAHPGTPGPVRATAADRDLDPATAPAGTPTGTGATVAAGATASAGSASSPTFALAADWLPLASPATADRSGRGDQAASRLFRQPGSTPD